MSAPRALAVAAGVSLMLPLMGVPAVAAKPRADLQVASVKVTTSAPVAGGTIHVTDKVKNAGRRKAGRSVTGYWLSRDGSVGSGDERIGTHKVPAIRPRKSKSAKISLTLPETAAGSWRLIACADIKRKVREAKEGNNCRASAAFTITTPDQEEPTATGTWAEASPRLRVLDRGNDHLTLSWPAAARDRATTGFRLAWNGGQQLLEPGIMHTQITDLTPGSTYTLTVTAIKNGADLPTPLSTSVQTTTGLQAPPDLTITTGWTDYSDVGGDWRWGPPEEYSSQAHLRGVEWEYTLEIPRGALPGNETVRMAEIESVEGSSTSGGLIAGVRLEPSGLLLARPATLVITPRSETTPTPADVVPMIFSGDGQDAMLAPIDPLAPEYRIEVSHFSGVVLMQGTHEELTALVDNAETEIGRLGNEVYSLFAAEHARVGAEGGTDFDAAVLQQIEARLDAAWDQAVLMLQAATTDDRLATRAVSMAMSLARSAALAGLDSTEYDADLDRYLPLIMQNAYDAANARCKVNLDPREVRNMLVQLRYGEMMGMPLRADPADLHECMSTSVQLDLEVTTEAFDVPDTAGVCCRGLSRDGGTVKASVELEPVLDAQGRIFPDGPYYGGVAIPELSGLVAERSYAALCFLRIGEPAAHNAIPLLASPSINPTVDPDAPARIRLEIVDYFPGGTQHPPFRTEFDVSFSYATGDPDNPCGPTATVQGDAWNGFPEQYGGIGGPWHLNEGTTTFATASDRYRLSNIGGSASLSFTVTPRHDGIG